MIIEMIPYVWMLFGAGVGAAMITGIVYGLYAVAGRRLNRQQLLKVFVIIWLLGVIIRIAALNR
jgi:hypothetical protein